MCKYWRFTQARERLPSLGLNLWKKGGLSGDSGAFVVVFCAWGEFVGRAVGARALGMAATPSEGLLALHTESMRRAELILRKTKGQFLGRCEMRFEMELVVRHRLKQARRHGQARFEGGGRRGHRHFCGHPGFHE
jgi:hypothetical protein